MLECIARRESTKGARIATRRQIRTASIVSHAIRLQVLGGVFHTLGIISILDIALVPCGTVRGGATKATVPADR